MKSGLLAFQFLTRLPLRFNLTLDDRAFARAQCFYPLVGAFVGCFSFFFFYILRANSFLICCLGAVVAHYAITGAFHLDGTADFADGFFSGKPKEKILDIMRDSATGVYGVLAIVACVLLRLTLLVEMQYALHPYILFAAAVFGKIPVAVCSFGKYARQSGKAEQMLNHTSPLYPLISMGICFAALYVLLGLMGLAIGLILGLFGFLMLLWSTKKIGGVTGDVFGACCEGGEILYLIVLFLLERNLIL